MAWENALSEIFQRYTGGSGGASAAPEDAHSDFQQVAQNAPQEEVASGLSQAMRSDRTPPFAEMASNLFMHSNPQQRAGLLNRLLGSVGPGVLSGLGGLGSLGGLLTGGGQVTPEQASQVQPQDVQKLADQAEKANPSVVDEVSSFYSQHPDVVKALGGMALAIAIQHIARRR